MFRHIAAVLRRPALLAQERDLDRKIAAAQSEIEILRNAELAAWDDISRKCQTALRRA